MADRETKDTKARSWFIVCPNVRENGAAGASPKEVSAWTDQQICEYVVSQWTKDSDTKQAACLYCKSKEGMEHLHVVLSGNNAMRFSTVKKFMGTKAHIEMTKGNKKQVEDYINKRGAFEEKGETILAKAQMGELVGRQGQRTDWQIIREGIEAGMTWKEVRRLDDKFFSPTYTTAIKQMYYDYRAQQTPFKRKVKVHWFLGDSGSGKTGITLELVAQVGEDNVYMVNDYKNPFDEYSGQRILVLDEFRGQLPYGLLLTISEGYKSQCPARYSNVTGLWDEIYITTILNPEKVYKKMMEKADSDDEKEDPIDQMMRRITDVTYCYKVLRENGSKTDDKGRNCEFYRYTVSSEEYKSYGKDSAKQLKREAYRDYCDHYLQAHDTCEAFSVVDGEPTKLWF